MTDQIPDSISFGMLRQLHSDKSPQIDFSDPRISHEIGDLAFLVTTFVKQKAPSVGAHQVVFLADLLVTGLRQGFQRQVDELVKDGGPIESVALNAKFAAHLSIAEAILDGMMSKLMKEGGFKDTAPSFQLVKSLNPAIRPHEMQDWIKSLGSLLE